MPLCFDRRLFTWGDRAPLLWPRAPKGVLSPEGGEPGPTTLLCPTPGAGGWGLEPEENVHTQACTHVCAPRVHGERGPVVGPVEPPPPEWRLWGACAGRGWAASLG